MGVTDFKKRHNGKARYVNSRSTFNLKTVQAPSTVWLACPQRHFHLMSPPILQVPVLTGLDAGRAGNLDLTSFTQSSSVQRRVSKTETNLHHLRHLTCSSWSKTGVKIAFWAFCRADSLGPDLLPPLLSHPLPTHVGVGISSQSLRPKNQPQAEPHTVSVSESEALFSTLFDHRNAHGRCIWANDL